VIYFFKSLFLSGLSGFKNVLAQKMHLYFVELTKKIRNHEKCFVLILSLNSIVEMIVMIMFVYFKEFVNLFFKKRLLNYLNSCIIVFKRAKIIKTTIIGR
jgi:hypothetical protein